MTGKTNVCFQIEHDAMRSPNRWLNCSYGRYPYLNGLLTDEIVCKKFRKKIQFFVETDKTEVYFTVAEWRLFVKICERMKDSGGSWDRHRAGVLLETLREHEFSVLIAEASL